MFLRLARGEKLTPLEPVPGIIPRGVQAISRSPGTAKTATAITADSQILATRFMACPPKNPRVCWLDFAIISQSTL